jgi:fluoride exporter
MGFLWVALGGALGSSARYGVNLVAPRVLGAGFPWATLIVNVLGCFAMGYLNALLREKLPDDENMRLFLTTGVLGGFTTFSAFSLDFFGLMQRGEMPLAVAYAIASVVLSILAVMIGVKLFAFSLG